jgi:hypothetical protein
VEDLPSIAVNPFDKGGNEEPSFLDGIGTLGCRDEKDLSITEDKRC